MFDRTFNAAVAGGAEAEIRLVAENVDVGKSCGRPLDCLIGRRIVVDDDPRGLLRAPQQRLQAGKQLIPP